MPHAVLGIGSNLGDREDHIARALDAMEQLPKTEIIRLSGIYETAPFDVLSEQQDYLNCCVQVNTELEPESLLEKCLEIETKHGRERTEYHGARTLDIDLLLYEGFQAGTEQLTVPHPGIRQRAFVLVPLSDIFPQCEAYGFDFRAAFETVEKEGVRLYK